MIPVFGFPDRRIFTGICCSKYYKPPNFVLSNMNRAMMNEFFESKKDYGIFLLRLVIGFRLVEGMWNIIFNGEIQGVADYFNQIHLPLPALSAVLAVYAEFICGFLFILGLWVRPAAAVMVFTFTIALVFVDLYIGFEKAFPAWAIFSVSVFLLFSGPGKVSIDEKIKKYKMPIEKTGD